MRRVSVPLMIEILLRGLDVLSKVTILRKRHLKAVFRLPE